jgi:Bacterial alpha-L-rhamnosidase 6 hairpin glycosidase domain
MMWNSFKYLAIPVVMALPFISASQSNFSLLEASKGLPHLYGKKENAGYLYVTAGDRLYSIGDQAGNFPAIGFHVSGEMGGVWQQPIKLLDGFRLTITDRKTGVHQMMDKADSFITYSFTSQFLYRLPQQNIIITRTQFVPDNIPLLVVEYAVTNYGDADKELTIQLAADVNLMPVWLGERTGMIDGTDALLSFDRQTSTLFFKDNKNPWYVGISAESWPADFTGVEKSHYQGKGLTGSLSVLLKVAKGKTGLLRFYISGSGQNSEEIKVNIALAKRDLSRLFKAKKQRYQQLEKNASVNIPDQKVMEAYQWGKYSSDWLVRDVPGMGRAMSAGLPDYPWFFSNDQSSAFDALFGTVEPDIFYSSWKMLNRVSYKANGDNGRIIHEVSSNGSVYDKGRMEESQSYIITAWNIFRWTGNISFLNENYEHGKKVWKWLQEHDTDHNGYIEGYGGAEIEGLNSEMLDVQVATEVFLETMSDMASILNDRKAARAYHQLAEQLRININRDWWVPKEKRYGDFISTKEKAISIIDTALAKRVDPARNAWAQKKLTELKASIQNGTYPYHAYVVYYNAGASPLEAGVADSSKAVEALKEIGFFTNKYGLYISGIERPDNIRLDEGAFQHDKEFNYNRAVMPIATANLVIIACRYGSPDTALRYMHILLNSFSFATPGTTYEVSPDYGMFVQAWNIRGINTPLIHYFFGIDPLAYKKEIRLRPNFPVVWENASIKDVIVGDNLLSFDYRKLRGTKDYTVKITKPLWTVKLYVGCCDNILLNGKVVKPHNGYIILKEKISRVRILQKQ